MLSFRFHIVLLLINRTFERLWASLTCRSGSVHPRVMFFGRVEVVMKTLGLHLSPLSFKRLKVFSSFSSSCTACSVSFYRLWWKMAIWALWNLPGFLPSMTGRRCSRTSPTRSSLKSLSLLTLWEHYQFPALTRDLSRVWGTVRSTDEASLITYVIPNLYDFLFFDLAIFCDPQKSIIQV